MNRLKALRKEQNRSQDELAKLLNVSSMTISRWENAEQLSLKIEKAQKLAEYFGVSVAYLLGYSGDKIDSPLSFDSPEAFEKARAELLEKLQNSDTEELALAYSGKELTGIVEKVVSRYEKEKEFLDQFFQLEEKDKGIIRYLVENLVKNRE